MEGTDVCFAPVLGLDEAPKHPHNVARKSFVEVGGAPQHFPTPRFSRTSAGMPEPPRKPGQDTREVLLACGFESSEIDALIEKGAIAAS